jgi:hypothetical protein
MKIQNTIKLHDMICIIFFTLPHLAMASQHNTSITEVRYTAEFSEADLRYGKFNDYDVINMKDAHVFSALGKPVLPKTNVRIAIPAGTEVIDIEAQALNSFVIPGEFYIMPGQPPLKTSGSDSKLFVKPDDDVYGSDLPYPDKLVHFVLQSDLAGQEIVEISVYPLQYVPKDKRLILHTHLELIVTCTSGKTREPKCKERYYNLTERQRKLYEEMVKTMVVNPQDVVVNPPLGEISRMLPPGEYDHVIITTSSFSSYFQPLVDWHMKKGLRDTIVTTSWIYSHYAGPGDTLQIRQFIMDAAGTWGTMYFHIGGEDDYVPFAWRYYYGDYPSQITPSDEYYSDYDDDWTHEVFVGRASVHSTGEITAFVDKVLKYEREPPVTDYPLNVLLIGMDADDYTAFEDLKEVIDFYIPARFNVTKVYDSDHRAQNHRQAVINALNTGQNLVNHADHAYYTFLCTGIWNHDEAIDNSDVDELTNNNKMSIVVSLGCYANGMDYDDCIAEHFAIYNPHQAGVAFIGNTRNGWYIEGVPVSLSGVLDRDWWRGVFMESQDNLGKAFIWSKHQFGEDDSISKHCEWTFNLLGDPAMPIWTDTPASFVVTHEAKIPIGTTSYSVHVTSGGNPVNEAYVCLWKQNDGLYETGYTDASGNVILNLSPPPKTTGMMYVTVTKSNHLPYEGTAQVTVRVEYEPISRNRTRCAMNEELGMEVDINRRNPKLIHKQLIPISKPMMIFYSISRPGHVVLNVYDVTGRLVKTLVNTHKDEGIYSLQWNGNDNNNHKLVPGVYFIKLASDEFTSVEKVILTK